MPIATVTVVTTRESVEILTRAPIVKEKSSFKTVTTTFLPSDKVPDSLSSIYVPSKKSPVTTDYIHPRIDIFGPEYSNFMFGGADIFKNLENKCIDMDKACHNYF